MTNNALALAAMGLRVFPLTPGEKAPPLIKGFPEHATRATEVIRAWWEKWPTANIGVHCAGLVVIDVDVRSGGPKSLDLLQLMEGLPETLTTLTPTGGRHLFYRLPEGHPGVGNSAGKLGAGLDVKTTGGYVVAPGSTVEAGTYRFEADVPIAPAPEWLVQQLGVSTERERSPNVDIDDATPAVVEQVREWLKVQPAGEGAYATACGLRDRGLSLAQALDAMADHDPRSNVPEKVRHAYEYAQNAPGMQTPVTAASFTALPADQLPPPAPRVRKPTRRLLEVAQAPGASAGYVVKGLLNKRSQAVLYGAPGQGKTFVALAIAYHVAAGLEWHGRRVKGGPVLYLAFEGMGGISRRAQALIRHYGQTDVPLFIHGAEMNLRERDGRAAVAEVLATLPEQPVLIVIDTLARAMKGGDENSAQDVGQLNDAVAALIEATGACVLLIHHSGKNKANGARGSSALLGAIDTELEVDDRGIHTRKQRDVELADPVYFSLRPVLVGVDEDGDEVSSCVVEPAQAPAVPADIKLTGNTARVWGVLCDLGGPSNTPVDIETLIGKCTEFLPDGKRGRQMLYDARRALKKKGLVVERENGRLQRRLE